MATKRQVLIKELGIDSLEYIQRVVDDQKEVTMIEMETFEEVCKLLNISDHAVSKSQDLYIGTVEAEETVEVSYIGKFLHFYLNHPFSSDGKAP